MSTSTSAPSDIQISPEAQALFEQILEQRLEERDEYYFRHKGEAEARRMQREQEFQAEIAAHHVALESISRQLEESQVNQL